MALGGLGKKIERGRESTRAGSTTAAAENGMRGGGGGGGGELDEDGGSVSPALRLRAVEASNDCERLGRRLVELVIKEASMALRESDFDVTLREHKARESGAAASTTASIGNDSMGKSDVDKTTESQDLARHGRNQHRTGNSCSGDAPREKRCQGCDRLAHANVELTRLLLQTSALRARDEASCSDVPMAANTPSSPTTTAASNAQRQGAARRAGAATTTNKHRAATTAGRVVNRKKRAPSAGKSTKVVVVVSPTRRPKSSGRRTTTR
ncbi:unnamed protein product [Ectocarpus fasciculatus]